MDVTLALRFLDSSTSRMIGLARSWMETREEPIDLLFVLSREVGQALGPWETFRLCALLGLTPAHAVRELGLDVLEEPIVCSREHLPPVSQAFAIAHARATWPRETSAYASAVSASLCEAESGSTDSYAIAAAAVASALASGPNAEQDIADASVRVPVFRWQPDEPGVARALPLLRARLQQGPLEKGVPELAELYRLCPAAISADLQSAFQHAISQAQQEDGGFGGPQASRRFRELTTLRVVLALHPLRGAPSFSPAHE